MGSTKPGAAADYRCEGNPNPDPDPNPDPNPNPDPDPNPNPIPNPNPNQVRAAVARVGPGQVQPALLSLVDGLQGASPLTLTLTLTLTLIGGCSSIGCYVRLCAQRNDHRGLE